MLPAELTIEVPQGAHHPSVGFCCPPLAMPILPELSSTFVYAQTARTRFVGASGPPYLTAAHFLVRCVGGSVTVVVTAMFSPLHCVLSANWEASPSRSTQSWEASRSWMLARLHARSHGVLVIATADSATGEDSVT